MTARNEEMLEAMIASNDAQLKLWETKETPGAGALQPALGSPMEEQIRANERARVQRNQPVNHRCFLPPEG